MLCRPHDRIVAGRRHRRDAARRDGPGVRATRVPPVSALHADALDAAQPRGRRRAPYVAAAVSLLGLLALLQGLFGSGPAASRLGALAGGAVLLFVGVALVARSVVKPIAGAIGRRSPPLRRAWPARARERDAQPRAHGDHVGRADGRPRRSSCSWRSSPPGLKTSITGSLERARPGRRRRSPPRASSRCRPTRRTAVRSVPGVYAAVGQYMDRIQVNGKPVNQITDTIDGVEARILHEVYRPEWLRGGTDALIGRLRGDTALSRSSSPRPTASRSATASGSRRPRAAKRRCTRSASTAIRRSSRASSSTCRPSSASPRSTTRSRSS